MIRHTGYTVSYNAETKIPNWVAWTLTPERFEETVSRYDKFLPDPEVVIPVTTEDYKRSGYDRGHLCPAADNKWDEQAMRESFYMTNVCPQDHNLNRGDWKELEEACRDWTMENGGYMWWLGLFSTVDSIGISAKAGLRCQRLSIRLCFVRSR